MAHRRSRYIVLAANLGQADIGQPVAGSNGIAAWILFADGMSQRHLNIE